MTNETPPVDSDVSVESSGNPADAGEVIYFEGRPALRGSLGHLLFAGLAGAGIIVGAVTLHAQGWWVPLVAPFMRDPTSSQREQIPVPKGPVEVW